RIDMPTDFVPTIKVDAPLASALEPAITGALSVLARTLPKRRWFRAKARKIKSVDLHDLIGVGEGPSRGALAFQPVVDGTTLPRTPLEMIEAGSARGVHLLVGTNRHEATLFNFMDPELADVDDNGVVERVAAWYGADAGSLVAAYRARRPDVSGLDLWTDVGTDAVFRIPAIRLAETQLAHGPVWMYLFTWETPVFGGVLKSSHALEIPFVFDTLESAVMFTGDAPERRDIADAMHAAWIAFARTGDPNTDGVPTWPAYDRERRATMRFDVKPEVLDDPMGDDRAAWGDFRR
ncbi:MAG: carboxylesterase family protein, partial [Acidimicrobiia bacterium]